MSICCGTKSLQVLKNLKTKLRLDKVLDLAPFLAIGVRVSEFCP